MLWELNAICNKRTAWIKYRIFYCWTCPCAQQLLSYEGCIHGTIHIIQNGTRSSKRKAELIKKQMDRWMAKQLSGPNIVVFRQVCSTAKSAYWLRYVCQSAWNNSAPSGRIFLKFDIWVLLEYVVRKIKVSLQYDKHNGYFTWRSAYIYGNIAQNCS